MTTRRIVLTFKPRQLISEVAYLGERIVGEIMPNPKPHARATWRATLVDWPRRQGMAGSFKRARDAIRREVEEWLVSAGLLDPGAGVDVVLDEALEERQERARYE